MAKLTTGKYIVSITCEVELAGVVDAETGRNVKVLLAETVETAADRKVALARAVAEINNIADKAERE